ncbi:hypothetical protein V8D89_004051 [Ganoderma adspersum]
MDHSRNRRLRNGVAPPLHNLAIRFGLPDDVWNWTTDRLQPFLVLQQCLPGRSIHTLLPWVEHTVLLSSRARHLPHSRHLAHAGRGTQAIFPHARRQLQAAGLDSDALPPSIVVTQDGIELNLEEPEPQPEHTEEIGRQPRSASQTTRASSFGPHQRRIYLFTFAFVVERLAAGISLGYGATAPPWKPADNAGGDRPKLSLPGPVTLFVLGLAGEAAATLGFATTLLSASLPVAECKRHVLLYAAARPLAAFLSSSVTTLSQTIHGNQYPLMIVINSFASGLFVYAALVVRALIANSRTTARRGLLARVSLMAAGALLPYILPMVVMIGHVFWYDGKLGRDTPAAEVAQMTVV